MPALPSWLLKVVRVLLKRPSDVQIRTVRVLFALSLAGALFLAHGRYELLPAVWAQYDDAAQWALMVLAFPALWTGLTGMCCAKKKTVRLGQLGLAVVLFALGGWLMRDLAPATPAPAAAPVVAAATGAVRTVSLDEAAGVTGAPETPAAPAAPLPAGFWVGLLGWLPLLAGVTGKMVTAKCLKYGEKITKVRV